MTYQKTVGSAETGYVRRDGIRLFYRRWHGSGVPVVCMPGLTRNSRDFEDLAARLAGQRDVVTVDFRGRGFSDRDPNWRRYQPPTYRDDMWAVLDELGIERTLLVGTSLGGIVSMLMCADRPGRVAGVVLNDIGPEIDPAGLERISRYTGSLPGVRDWREACAQAREIYGNAWPGLDERRWERLARRAYREDAAGIPSLDMDPNIGRALREAAIDLGDPWDLFDSMRAVPVLVLRGAHSDILAAGTVERMRKRHPDLRDAVIANRGHVPLLDEPDSIAALDAFLETVR